MDEKFGLQFVKNVTGLVTPANPFNIFKLHRELFHVDNSWDMEKQKQELLQAERQEELLKLRDRNNKAILKILEAVSPKKTTIALPLWDQPGSRPHFQDSFADPQDIVLEYKY